MKFILSIIGLIMILEGLPYFLSPIAIKKVIAFLLDIDDSNLRKMGFGLMISGLVVVWAGVNFF